jgi:hypothetical protein
VLQNEVKFLEIISNISVTSLIKLERGGGGEQRYVFRNLIYDSATLQIRGEGWFEAALNIHTPLSPLSPIFLFAFLHLSSQKKIIRR